MATRHKTCLKAGDSRWFDGNDVVTNGSLPVPEERSLQSAPETLQPDVLVVGAGPAGSAAAAMLAQQGVDVLLVDKRAFPRDKICGDVVGPMAVDCLAKMGALDKVLSAGAHRVDQVHIHSPDGRSLTAGFEDMLDSPNAYTLVVQRTDLDHALLNFARDAGATVLERTAVTRIAQEGNRIEHAELQSPDGTVSVRPRYTILATGANVGLLKRTGMLNTDTKLIYGSRGYFGIDDSTVSGFNLYYLKDLLPGYAWVFPTGSSRANIGMGAWGDRKLSDDMVTAFASRFANGSAEDDARLETQVKSYPIRTDFPPTQLAGDNWLLVGEAAGMVNPLSGEGIDLALESGCLAAECLLGTLKSDAGSSADLYRRRAKDQFGQYFRHMNFLCRQVATRPWLINRLVSVMSRDTDFGAAFVAVVLGISPGRNVLKPRFLRSLFLG